MNQVPTKIVLKSTTRMSLNDRFSTIVPTVQTIRANKAAEQQVSSANRRLAQQLANRPGIPQNQVNNMMMYNNNMNNNMNMNMNNNSNMMMRGQGRGRRGGGALLQNRVGRGNIKARLTLPPNRARGGQRGGRGGGRGAGNQNYNMNNNMNMNMNNNNNMNNAMTSPFNKPRGRGFVSSRSPRGRGGFRGGRGQQQFNRFTGQATGRGAVRGGGANQRGGGVRGRGNNRGGRFINNRGGRGRGNRGGGAASAQDLDSQLDQYMAKTKSTLDSDLDAYMAQVSTD